MLYILILQLHQLFSWSAMARYCFAVKVNIFPLFHQKDFKTLHVWFQWSLAEPKTQGTCHGVLKLEVTTLKSVNLSHLVESLLLSCFYFVCEGGNGRWSMSISGGGWGRWPKLGHLVLLSNYIGFPFLFLFLCMVDSFFYHSIV